MGGKAGAGGEGRTLLFILAAANKWTDKHGTRIDGRRQVDGDKQRHPVLKKRGGDSWPGTENPSAQLPLGLLKYLSIYPCIQIDAMQ